MRAAFPKDDPSRRNSAVPVTAQFDSAHLTIGGGVAIFHIATARVVLCYHPLRRYHFLPKGRRDTGEESGSGAEREGYEESGYRNRLLPIPLLTRQPKPQNPRHIPSDYVKEPIWTQLLPVTDTAQYILHWFIAETVPPLMDVELTARQKQMGDSYQAPLPFEEGMTLRERMELDVAGKEGFIEPRKHLNTGVDEEEMLYESRLVGIEEAIKLLGERNVSADVVRKGWRAIELRLEMEEKSGTPISRWDSLTDPSSSIQDSPGL